MKDNIATAVFYHHSYPDQVVKVYAPGRPGFDQELEVYRRLGSNPALSVRSTAASSTLPSDEPYSQSYTFTP